MKASTIIGFMVVLIVVAFFMNLIVYNLASEICEESEVRPVRYEYGGIFNQRTIVETTEGNHDAYEKICLRHGRPSFYGMSDNLQYILDNAEESDVNVLTDETGGKS